jgi:hypothetical protein
MHLNFLFDLKILFTLDCAKFPEVDIDLEKKKKKNSLASGNTQQEKNEWTEHVKKDQKEFRFIDDRDKL